MFTNGFEKSFSDQMATIETIRALCDEPDINSAVTQIHKIIKDKPDVLNQSIETLAKLISDEKDQKLKPKYMFFLTSVLRKNAANVSVAQLLESIRAAIPEEGRKEQHRRRRTGYILCLACVSRAGLLSENLPVLKQYVERLYQIAFEHPFHSAQVYSIIVDMAVANIPDADSFMDTLLPVLKETQNQAKSDIDILYFWIAIAKHFPKVTMDEKFRKPVTKEFLEEHQDLLIETKNFKPSIHPIWKLLASIDYKNLVSIISEIWVPDYKKYQPIIAYASAACVPLLSDDEFIEFLGNQALLVSALSFVPEKIIIPVLQPRIAEFFKQGVDASFRILVTLLSIEGEHSFITKIVNEKLSKFTDEETTKLLGMLKDAPFSSFRLLLWAQKTRTNISNFEIVTEIFKAAAEHAKTQEDRLELSNFVGVCLLRMANGITWFTLLTGIEFSLSDAPQSINELADLTNKLIDGVNKINKILNLQSEVEKVEPTIQSISKRCGEMLRSPHVHMQKIGRLQLERSLKYLDPSTAPAIFCDAELLRNAVKMPALCATVLPYFLDHIREIPEATRKAMLEEPFMKLPISPEDAVKIAQNTVNRCKPQENESSMKLQDRYSTALVNMLKDEDLTKLIESQITKILVDESDGGINVITNLINSSSQTAFDIISFLTKISTKVGTPKRLEIMRNWISECCKSGDLGSDVIADAIFSAVDYNYQETNSGKKRAEAALEWAEKLLRKLERDIPREKFQKLIPIVVATGSRKASNLIRQITLTNE